MDNEIRKKISEKLGDIVEFIVNDFFEKSGPEKMIFIQQSLNNLLDRKDPLRLLVEKTFTELISEIESESNGNIQWESMDDEFLADFDHQFQTTFQYFFLYSLLYCVLSKKNSAGFDIDYLNESRKQFGLSGNGQLQKAMSQILNNCFWEEIIQGGKESTLKSGEQAKFLAYYNRFLIVIKNARKDFRQMRKVEKTKREEKIKSEILEKYEIPAEYSDSLFSIIAASEVALSWAKQQLNVNLTDAYCSDLFTNLRKKYGQFKIIVGYQSYPMEMIFAVHPKNEELKQKLKFTDPYTSWEGLNQNPFVAQMGGKVFSK